MRKPILKIAGLVLLGFMAYMASFFVYPDVGALAKLAPRGRPACVSRFGR